jgi:hypothetical protein
MKPPPVPYKWQYVRVEDINIDGTIEVSEIENSIYALDAKIRYLYADSEGYVEFISYYADRRCEWRLVNAKEERVLGYGFEMPVLNTT